MMSMSPNEPGTQSPPVPPPPTPSGPRVNGELLAVAALGCLTLALAVALMIWGQMPKSQALGGLAALKPAAVVKRGASPDEPPPTPEVVTGRLELQAIGPVRVGAGERAAVEVRLKRDNLDRPVALRLEGLPPGIQATAATIPQGQDTGSIELTVANTAAGREGQVRVIAEAGDVRADGKFTVSVAFPPQPPETLENSVGMKLRLIHEGSYLRGAAPGAGDADEEPLHQVLITKPFYLGAHEVTVGQFREFVQATGYKPKADGLGYVAAERRFERRPTFTWEEVGWPRTDRHPVVNVSWNDAQKFCEWLGKKEGKTYRLPTEGEWEYACRAGTVTSYNTGPDAASLRGAGNIADASFQRTLGRAPRSDDADDGSPFTAAVGERRPNPWGLYDMHGNVWEWCADWYGPYPATQAVDPHGPDKGDRHVVRGGSWLDGPQNVHSSSRQRFEPDFRTHIVGFRVVMELPAPPK